MGNYKPLSESFHPLWEHDVQRKTKEASPYSRRSDSFDVERNLKITEFDKQQGYVVKKNASQALLENAGKFYDPRYAQSVA